MGIPKIFISYSWDDGAHKKWVRDLATRLRQDGVNVTLDQWHAAPGDQLPAFMDRAIRENDFILIVCTPQYKANADSRHGGVGYEGDVLHGEIFITGNHRKFIPVLRDGEWVASAPSSLLGKYYIDLRDSPDYENNYRELVLTLHGKRDVAPAIGETPPLLAAEKGTSADPRDSQAKLRNLPKPRQYTFISDKKVEDLFPQLPLNFIQSFRNASAENNPFFKVGVVAQYIEEMDEVGTIDHPKAYFRGIVNAQCLVTDAAVFFGSQIRVAPEERKFKYVGLSGSLKHMRDAPFRELANNDGYVGRELYNKLERAKAQYFHLTSSTVAFNDYLLGISSAVWRKEQEAEGPKKLPGGKAGAGGVGRVGRWLKSLNVMPRLIIIGLLVCAIFLSPLAVFIKTSQLWGRWALILIPISALWALIGVGLFYVAFRLRDFMGFSLGSQTPSLECSIKIVTSSLSSTVERYEFLAKTIAVGECEGERVVLGSPLYIALGGYEPSQPGVI